MLKKFYKFNTRANLKTSQRRTKEGRTKAKMRRMKRMTGNVDKILSATRLRLTATLELLKIST